MGKKAKKSRLAGIPAWALSLMTFFASFLLFGLELPESIETSIDPNIFGLIIYVIFLTAACFIICKTHPKSIWYTPFICNAFIIFLLISILSSTQELSFLILLSACIVLSVIGAFVGARFGRRLINQGK
ncbi:MAG: hypothetical protein HN778_01085 [Prolixibacteraceae bacterium]|jgi:hypothetical protein|nr:hypothetical protein [Prolixibacteraceae bacterium]MBT6765384.1 hypothetical protein [Prolixibacteraceae bacterium]MBT6998743.1 hypothetical protein [Prolixibacteraceae bacterium]MBT7393403.1 hypothetical protein [Prolixibacteraceae bacterium]